MSTVSTISSYLAHFENTWAPDTHIDQVRFVVLDSETTGLNPLTDRIITIGAVGMQNGEIVLGDSFEALLKVAENTESVTVHGVTRDESQSGLDEMEAMALFLDYLRDGVIVGHHIGHDVTALNEAMYRHFGARLLNRWMDTMYLTLHLEKAGAFAGRPPIRRFTLDSLCTMFGVVPHGRHTAVGDAVITAEVFLHLRRLALKFNRHTLEPLCEKFEASD